MARNYKDYSPEQPSLLPVSPTDWMPEDHRAYQVYEVVQQLDLSLFHSSYSRDGRGVAAYSPKMMIALLLYSWSAHVYSSRQIERLYQNDIGARFLVAGHAPDFRSINLFIRRHEEALNHLFVQSIQLCRQVGMVGLLHVSIDGTKLGANASRNQSVSYAKLTEEQTRLSAEIAKLQKRALAIDEEEDTLYGVDNLGGTLPAELRTRQQRMARLKEAKQQLEAEAKQKEEQRKQLWDELEPSKRPHRKAPDPANGKPSAKAKKNLVDPQSSMMRSARGQIIQGYNAQLAVDSKNQIIVACDVSNEPLDYGQLLPMVQQTTRNVEAEPDLILADAGYFSAQNLTRLQQLGQRALIPPVNGSRLLREPLRKHLSQPQVQRLEHKQRQLYLLCTEQGRKDYALRAQTVEPVFGQIKGCPGRHGFTRFLRRGLDACRQQWRCVCAVHNIVKYLRFRPTRPQVTQ